MKNDGATSRIERHKRGKAIRKKCPRTSQGEYAPRSKSQDIIKLLEESDADRISGLTYPGRLESPEWFRRLLVRTTCRVPSSRPSVPDMPQRPH